jgi:hypothetical protein
MYSTTEFLFRSLGCCLHQLVQDFKLEIEMNHNRLPYNLALRNARTVL